MPKSTEIRTRFLVNSPRPVPKGSGSSGWWEGIDGVFPQEGLSFVLPLNDAGYGVVNITATKAVGTPTFTRATTAACRLANGKWNLAVASGSPRSHYSSTGQYLGYFSEAAATQILTNSRDLSQAAWAKVSTTGALTSIGLAGVTNSCSRVTATGANGTILQTSVTAAANHCFSAYVKRVTGSGTITLSCGVASLDITSLINTSTFTLVQVPDATLNAVCGFTIATSGDAIDVDATQLESGVLASSPLLDTGTRNADVLTFPFSGNGSSSQGSLYAEYYLERLQGAAGVIFGHDDGTANNKNFLILVGVSRYSGTTATVAQWAVDDATTYVANTLVKVAGRYELNKVQQARNGVLATEDTVATMPTNTTIVIGNGTAGTLQLQGCIKNCRIWNSPLADSQLQAITT